MGQLEEYKIKELWGDSCSPKITLLVHVLNRPRELTRLLESCKDLDRKIVLIDDRTTEDLVSICNKYGAEYEMFTWCDDFSYPKNILTRKVPVGEWCLVMGSDFELPPETVTAIKEFAADPLNCLAKFNVEEWVDDPAKKRRRNRVLFWRSHPTIYWEGLAHEEMRYSAFRLLRIGVSFRPDMDIPNLGRMWHYGDHENTPEEIWRKARYYNSLWEKNKIKTCANMQDYWGDLYSVLPLLKSVEEVKAFMDARVQPGFQISKLGSVYTPEEIHRAMTIIRLPAETSLREADYD